MNEKLKCTISRIHGSNVKAVLCVSGVGSKAITWLLEIPGASNTILEGIIPYSQHSLIDFMGKTPSNFVSEKTSQEMARESYKRAVKLREDNFEVIGIACTGAINTNRERRGANHAYISICSQNSISSTHIELKKGLRTRVEEETIISHAILDSISKLLWKESSITICLESSENINTTQKTYHSSIEALLDGHIDSYMLNPDGTSLHHPSFTGTILSGSFNPLHEGHRALAETAKNITGDKTVFEISATNVDKPSLSVSEVNDRARQFNKLNLLITSAPLFSEKANLFPGSTFVIGYDTAVRLLDRKYYNDDEIEMYRSLETIDYHNCSFLVAGRLINNTFSNLSDLTIPKRFEHLLQEIPENQFRVDQSSSKIRQKGDN